MPTHSEKRNMPYTAKQMFDLVADVPQYPAFLPWCAGCRVRSDKMVDGKQVLEADLMISFKVFREKFGSRVTLDAEKTHILTEYLDGPFRYLKSHWHFQDSADGCDVEFFVDFEFKNAILQGIIGVVFNEAMHRIVAAFEKRAQELYG